MADEASALPAGVRASPFGVQFQEAIDFLKGKIPEASARWDSLAGVAHAKVFTVAGAATADLARDFQQALVTALEQGQTLTSFRKDFDAIVAKHGWSYNGKRGWRSEVIFNANMRSAHMAGRWEQLVANADRRPYLQYRTAGDGRVRPQHRAWDRLIYQIGDAFWATHYPPNGWNCRCTVRAYGSGEMAAKGLQVSRPIPVQYREVLDADGVSVDRVPVGIDPGWDHNVGQSWIAPELALGRKLASLPPQMRGAVVDKTISPAFQTALSDGWNRFRTAVAAKSIPAHSAQVLGFLDSRTLGGLAAHAPGLELQSTAFVAFADQAAALAPGAAAPAWPSGWIDDLPAEVRSYRAVLWDRQAGELVVVAGRKLGDALAVARFAPNAGSEVGHGLALKSLGSADTGDLGDAQRFIVLSGKLEGDR